MGVSLQKASTNDLQEAIERIRQMEAYFEQLLGFAEENPQESLNEAGVREVISVLTRYYESGQWLQDYERDEKGLLPGDLKRGVLSQDGLYDLLDRLKICSTLRR